MLPRAGAGRIVTASRVWGFIAMEVLMLPVTILLGGVLPVAARATLGLFLRRGTFLFKPRSRSGSPRSNCTGGAFGGTGGGRLSGIPIVPDLPASPAAWEKVMTP
ncbi:MAG TPA: hypothetical protein VMU54_20395 [Planctomycetota bacterium]|nr:hypothetical protein [Planctomycetota bacterium]